MRKLRTEYEGETLEKFEVNHPGAIDALPIDAEGVLYMINPWGYDDPAYVPDATPGWRYAWSGGRWIRGRNEFR